MSEHRGTSLLGWHVIETGDRWYQAILRFTATAAADPGSVHRWQPAEAGQLPGWLAQQQAGHWVLLWEVAAEPAAALETLDRIAAVRRFNAHVVQLAHVPARWRAELALAVQEAGATLVLDQLWSLQRVVKRLEAVDEPAA